VPPVIDPRIIDWEKVHAHLVEHGRPLGNEILEGLACNVIGVESGKQRMLNGNSGIL